MLIFGLVIFIPFAIVTYKLSERNTLNSINASNDAVLSQINYTYKYLTNNMSNLCVELFFRNDVRKIMYNKDISYSEVILGIKELEDTILLTNPSIYSISIYNKKRDELYTTKMNCQISEQELFKFIYEQEEIVKLKPILRTITTHVGNIETTSYVFSYFMYEFGDPIETTSNFLVINQKANWIMDNIVSNTYSSNSFATSTYLLNNSGVISKSSNSTIEQKAQKYLIENYKTDVLFSHRSDPQHNIKSYNGKKYILSSVKLGDSDNFLLIIQDYNQVFKNRIELRNNFILVGICFVFTMTIALFLFSTRIYRPVNNLMLNLPQVENIAQENNGLRKVNEFEYLQSMYNSIDESKSILQSKAASLQPIVEHYHLFMLANDSNTLAYEQFKATMPEHWLSKVIDCNLCVIIFKIDKFEHNKFNFERSDLGLLLFAIQNIAEEIICDQQKYSGFRNVNNTYTLIIDFSCTDANLDVSDESINQRLYQKIQKTQTLVKQYLDITTTIAYSSIGYNVTEISTLFSEVKEHMSYSYISRLQSILNKDSCRINSENIQTNYPQELDSKLIKAMTSNDIEKIKIIFADIKNVVCTFKRNNITICLMALVNLVNKTIDDLNSQKGIIKNYGHIYQKVIDAEYMDDFFDELIKHIKENLMYDNTKSIESRDQIFISTVMNYIQKNYSDIDLSSASIADYLGMSSKYIMRKFKDCTSISLNDYIISFRMKKAASLLQNTDLTISKIAEEIGIENENYFYKLFKRVYDCTPREYTDMNCK
jgi:AraC-like DNA-binding protein